MSPAAEIMLCSQVFKTESGDNPRKHLLRMNVICLEANNTRLLIKRIIGVTEFLTKLEEQRGEITCLRIS